MKKVVKAVVIVAVVAAVAFVLYKYYPAIFGTSTKVVYSTSRVSRGKMQSTISATGTVEPEELRLVVAVPVLAEPADRVVRVFWSTLPAERVVEEPEERLTEELLPVERLVVAEVEEPVDRFVRVFWLTAPAERVL